MPDLYYLKIKTQKVQDFIFKVPKLKAMLGANSLLGEFFAEDLPGLRANEKKYSIPKCWIDFKSKLKALPEWENDDLKANFDKGVICSAGGHFETFFNTKEDADDFVKAVRKEAREKIPGVGISFFLKKYENFNADMKYKDFDDKGTVIPIDADTTEILIDNPYFYPSSEDGENPQLIDGYKKEKDSFITKNIKEAGDKFYNGEGKDYLCKFLKDLTKENDKELSEDKFSELFENDLTKFAKLSLIPKNNKIAVITIDGNAMGARFSKFRDALSDKPVFDALIEMEKFWFTHRNTFRNALHNSLNSIDISPYKQYNEKEKKELRKLPYHVMMLGGDDLLIVSVPEIAFDLVERFSENLQPMYDAGIAKLKMNSLEDNKISISAGIAFVKSSYPFAHAHELAESLLSSAKVKSRIWEKTINENGEEHVKTTYRNTIDWHVHFTSASVDIEDIRKQNYYLNYKDKNRNNVYEILTGKPYLIEDVIKTKIEDKSTDEPIIKENKKINKEISDKVNTKNQSEENSVIKKSKGIYEEISKNAVAENRSEDNSSGRNKYKRLRTLLKNGKANAELYSKILFKENNPLKFDDKLDYSILKIDDGTKIYKSTILDSLELIDFWKRKDTKNTQNKTKIEQEIKR